MKFRWIIGSGDYLDQVFHTCLEAFPDEQVERVLVLQSEADEFDLSVLNTLSSETGTAFVALDERFGNFKRMELMQAVMERGLKLDPLICNHASVAADAVIGMNVFVAPNVVIGHGCRIDFNTVIHAGATISPHVRIKSSCWLESGVQLGKGVEIGAHSTLRTGAIVAPHIKIGRHCELGWPQHYGQHVPDRTTFDLRYDTPIYIYGS